MTERPSGDPAWEGQKTRGLPVRRPEGEPPAADGSQAPVARWLGWSPTSWRTSR